MLVKKFEAETMTAALKLVKETLGADALILSTRTLRKKGLGVLGRQVIEVTAAIESPAMKNSAAPQSGSMAAAKKVAAAYHEPVELRDEEELEELIRQPAAPRRVEVAGIPLEEEVRSLRSRLEEQNVGQLRAEIDQLKGLVQQLTSTAPAAPASTPLAESEPVPFRYAEQPVAPRRQAAVSSLRQSVPGDLNDISELLTDQGIDSEAAQTIARFASQRMTERQRQEPQQRHEYLTRMVADLVQTSGPLWQTGEGQKRFALIGPTGVGKTTTIAKLAAEAITNYGARVALVTIDTYRIAAVEQLKVYGEIMGLPVEVVLRPEQLQEAINRHRDKDLILIDTAGRSPRDAEQIAELAGFLGPDSGVENCLVLAAPTAERQQQKILNSFGRLPLARLIFTKLDETDQCGALINLPTRSNLPLAYLTNGQKVPEDLLLAEPDSVARLVMAEMEQYETGKVAV